MNSLNSLGKQFADALAHAKVRSDERARYTESQEKAHVVGAGRTLTAAYEQLRNAAEYTEEDLLLQRAIKRFFKRLIMSRDEERIARSGEELVVELTLAGYIPNDSIPEATVQQISALAALYYPAYRQVSSAAATQPFADEWVTAVLAVKAESLISDHAKRTVFAQFAYDYFLSSIDKKKLFPKEKKNNYEAALLVAVYRGLFKSDAGIVRHMLLERYRQKPDALDKYVETNKLIDTLIESDIVDQLVRIINRRGAPLRVLWRMTDTSEDLPELIKNRGEFLRRYETQILNEYSQMNDRINKGIIKSVSFLIVTKFIIGIAIEVPYDYAFHGEILWVPLIVNLFFPPLYMILLRLTLTLPGPANTRALTDRIDTLLYKAQPAVTLTASERTGQYSSIFNTMYGSLMVVLFGLVGWGLWAIGFSIVHLAIFFIFISTASFLGFRLSRMIREIEAVDAQQNGFILLRDFLYLPFVVVGRWMSEKYAKVNIVALILDMVIELPLKTVIRLVQQWGLFISSKKDEL